LLVNKFIYGAHVPFTDWRLPAVREPEAGDIIVFQYPRNPEDDYIKRCVAVEGQRIEVRNKILYVDGKPQPLPPNGK
ncbi:MAG TPA: signal peptidase I, partial [Candidatus Latescibacteria bacterium]|nr:signal peptidase I [Candidatus Latescibacterota bacterium]